MMNPVKDMEKIFSAAIKAVYPADSIRSCVSRKGDELIISQWKESPSIINLRETRKIFVVGAGKATASMAEAIEEILGDRITTGIISVKEGYRGSLSGIVQREASHPVPDERGVMAAEEIFDLVSKAGKYDLIISLISGGGSALMPLPAQGITLEEKQIVTDLLLRAGSTIHEINSVRKHLSRIKGGLLARAAFPARVVNLVMSDVVGDDLDVIASGPLVPDRSSFNNVAKIVKKYSLSAKLPDSVRIRIEKGLNGVFNENPKSDDVIFEKVENHIIASNIHALKAAEVMARKLGYNTLVLSSMIEGSASETAFWHSRILREIYVSSHPVSRPACILSGGETTVVVKGNGKGGRNMEFAMCAIPHIADLPNVVMSSIGTDGTDGPTDAAGAYITGETKDIILREGLSLDSFRDNNDSYSLFDRIGGLIKTGPTNTNVMDIRIMIIF